MDAAIRAAYAAFDTMVKFLVFLILLVLCWPLALLALLLYPIVWLVSLPFRIFGVAVDGVLELVKAILFLPARLLGGRRAKEGPPASSRG